MIHHGYLLDNDVYDFEMNNIFDEGSDCLFKRSSSNVDKELHVEEPNSTGKRIVDEIYCTATNGCESTVPDKYASKFSKRKKNYRERDDNSCNVPSDKISDQTGQLLANILEDALSDSTNLLKLHNILEKFFKIDCLILSKTFDYEYGYHIIFQRYQQIKQPILGTSPSHFSFTLKEIHHRLVIIEEVCVFQLLPGFFQNEDEVTALWKTCVRNLNFCSEKDKLSMEEKFYENMNQFIDNNCVNTTDVTLKVDLYLVTNEEKSLIVTVMWEIVSLHFSQN